MSAGPAHWQTTNFTLICCSVWVYTSYLGLLLFRVKSWVVLNNAGLIGYVLQLISIKSLGDCHLSLGGQGAGAGAMHLSQPLIRKHTFACFVKGRGQGGGADTISAPGRYNCWSVNCCIKNALSLKFSENTWWGICLKGYNEGPSVSLCKQKSKTGETYLACIFTINSTDLIAKCTNMLWVSFLH